MVAAWLAALPTATDAAQRPRAFPGLEQRERVYAAIHQRAVRLGQAPSSGSTAPAKPALGETPNPTASDVQEIGLDRLATPGGAEDDTTAEPSIAVDPHDPNVVVAVFQEGRFQDIAAVGIGYSTSHDGGKTWTQGELPHLTQATGGPYERASDPVVTFGPDHAVYVTSIALDEVSDFRTAVTIQRSDDGGLTFGDPVIVREDTNPNVFNDKEWLAVDIRPNSPFFGRIYVVWDRIVGTAQPPAISSSDDRGQTWTPFHTLSDAANALGTYPLVSKGGRLTVVYLDVRRFVFAAQSSTDGGATFSRIVQIDECGAVDPPDQRDGGCIPSAAVDPSTGYLYVTWTDARFRSDGLDDVVVSRSTDGGQHWAPRVKVNHDGSGSGMEHMTAAVAAYRHTVHVTYLIRRKQGSTFSPLIREAYSMSMNDGAAYGGEITIGPTIDLTWSAVTTGLHFLGDYMAVASFDERAAHPVWCRSSEPPFQQTYHQTTWSATVNPQSLRR
jgi:hypothetical protein